MTEQTRKVMTSSERTDWETPPEVFEPLNEEFHFTLDVCAAAGNAKCARFFTEEEDGLARDWDGVCWMNPPYGRGLTRRWMKKAYEESLKGATVVCLVPARTDTFWWHEYAMRADEIRYVKGRIRFVGADSGAPFPSAVVVFRGRQSEEVKRLLEQNASLRAQLEAAFNDLKHDDRCDICKYAGAAPGCDVECDTCALDCKCGSCRDYSNWEWRGVKEAET